MAKRQKFQHFVCVLAFLSAASLRAQSLSDLEKELLLDDSSSSSLLVEEPKAPAKAAKAAPVDSGSAGDLLRDFVREDTKESDYAFDEKDRKDVQASALREIDKAISGPKQIPFDHILVVKHRYLNKEGRFELAPITVSIQPADSFRKQLGVGLSLAYHLSEDFALEFLHASFTTNYRTSLENDINAGVNQKLGFKRIEPVLTLGSAFWWAPFKGKSATIENVYHWEAFFLAGGGGTRTELAFAPMAMFGAGARLYLNRRAILRLEVRDYYDFTKQADHRVNVLAGASVLFGDN